LAEEGLDVEPGLAVVEEGEGVDLADRAGAVDEIDARGMIELAARRRPRPLVPGQQGRSHPRGIVAQEPPGRPVGAEARGEAAPGGGASWAAAGAASTVTRIAASARGPRRTGGLS